MDMNAVMTMLRGGMPGMGGGGIMGAMRGPTPGPQVPGAIGAPPALDPAANGMGPGAPMAIAPQVNPQAVTGAAVTPQEGFKMGLPPGGILAMLQGKQGPQGLLGMLSGMMKKPGGAAGGMPSSPLEQAGMLAPKASDAIY